MSDRKLTDLTEITTPSDSDYIYLVDVSDTTSGASGTSKKALLSNARGWPQTAAESAAGVTPTNYQYEPGNVLRYGTNTTPGTTDMTTAIDNAILANGGGDVVVPSGTYSHTGITAGTANVTMRLERGAILKLAAAAESDSITITADGFSIEGGEIDGNRANQSGTFNGVNSTGDQLTIKNVYIHGCGTNGIKLTQGNNVLIDSNRIEDVIQTGIITSVDTEEMTGLRVVKNVVDLVSVGTSQANGGIKIHSSDGTYPVTAPVISNNEVRLTQSASMPANAVCIETILNVPSASITGNTTVGGSIGITLSGAINGVMSGNAVTGPWNIGLECATSSSFSVLSGNTVRGDTVNPDIGVSCNTTTTNISVIGNVLESVEVDGIKLQSCDGSVVSGNVVTMATGAVRGVRMIESDQFSITGNIIDGKSVASTVALFLDSCSDGSIVGNTVLNTTNAFRVTDATTNGHSFANLVVTNNRFGNTGADVTTGFSTGGWGDGVKLEGNIGHAIETFADEATPSVVEGTHFTSNSATRTITALYDGYAGKEISIRSNGAITFDTSTATRLIGSTVDIVTAAGDITTWVCQTGGTTSSVWRLKGFVDVSVDNSAGA